MDIKTYMKRAYATKDMNRSNYHESNALHHLVGQLTYLADTTTLSGRELNGNELRKYGVHVIERIKEIVQDFETGKELGEKAKANLKLLKGGE